MKKVILFFVVISLLTVACNNKKTTDSADKKDAIASVSESKQERNKKVIMACMESFMKGDLDGTFKDAAPSFVDYGDGTTAPVTVLDSLKNFMKSLTTAIEGYKGANLNYYADGDHVLVTGDWGGTFKHDLMGLKATGRPFKFKDLDMFKLNDDGKLVEHSSVQNIGATLMAAGMTK